MSGNIVEYLDISRGINAQIKAENEFKRMRRKTVNTARSWKQLKKLSMYSTNANSINHWEYTNKTYSHWHRAMLWRSTHQEDEVPCWVLISVCQSKDYWLRPAILWSSSEMTRDVPDIQQNLLKEPYMKIDTKKRREFNGVIISNIFQIQANIFQIQANVF